MTVRQIIRAWQWRRAVRQANELAKLTKKKYFVLSVKGKFRVVSKQDITEMVRKHQFGNGQKVADIEKKALYITL